ncbi:MAG: nucleotide exchange factor GrpE [Bacteroidia bacterium]
MRYRVRKLFNKMMNQEETTSHEEFDKQQQSEEIISESEAQSEEPLSPEELERDVMNDEGWKKKFEDVNDKYLRLYSEFDNFRKRSAREKIDFVKTASADIFSAILPVLDDFDRASKAMEQSNDIAVVKEGMNLIHQKFWNILNQKGLEPLDAMGKDFDPDFYEAITSIPAADADQKGKVVDVVEKGYTLNGKVIRFAKVVVGS